MHIREIVARMQRLLLQRKVLRSDHRIARWLQIALLGNVRICLYLLGNGGGVKRSVTHIYALY